MLPDLIDFFNQAETNLGTLLRLDPVMEVPTTIKTYYTAGRGELLTISVKSTHQMKTLNLGLMLYYGFSNESIL